VELDLIRAGLLPEDLAHGENIYHLRQLETNQWWFSRTFELEETTSRDRRKLVIEGIDTLATVWLNGIRIASLENMLIPHRLDVTDQLRPGVNELQIGIDSVVLAAQEIAVEPGTWAMENNWESLSIRKAAHGFGWDIMPRILSAGLWRSIYLETEPATRFRSTYLATTEADPVKRKARLTVRWDLTSERWPIDAWSVRIAVASRQSGTEVFEQTVPVLSTHGFMDCSLDDIDLWWPRGYGEATLYDVHLELLDENGQAKARRTQVFGFRTALLEATGTTNEDGDGEFAFVINGLKVFAKGSNWVPLDALHSRDADRLEETLDLAVDLNCNMLRCWGGNVYETSAFYDRCDEAGIMVWQDFAFGCALYPQTPEFHAKVRKEAEAVVPLFRNHPSLVLWAGNNEIDAFYEHAKPNHDPNLDDQISREVLASVCRRLDPWRSYLPSSPYYGPELWAMGSPFKSRPEDHLWGPRDDYKGIFYTSSNAHFASEIGYHGCPAKSSLQKMMRPDQLWPWQENEDWLTHAARPQPRGKAYNYRIALMAHQIEVLFRQVPTNLDDFVFASQFSQAEALKFFVERFRANQGRRRGILWWNLRDGWPLISDAIVDYYGERKLAFGVIRRIQTDICVMIHEPRPGQLEAVAVNGTLRPAEFQVTVRDGDRVLIQKDVNAPANDRVIVGTIPESTSAAFYRIEWTGTPGPGRNHYLAGPRPFDLRECRDWYESAGLAAQSGNP